MKKSYQIIITLLCSVFALVSGAIFAPSAQAQSSNVGIGTTSPDASALLEMQSTNKGLLIPRVTYAQKNAIAGPATGLLVFQTDSISPSIPSTFYYWNGIRWVPFLYSGTAWQIYGNTGTNATNNFLGTIDSIDLVFRTNNRKRMQIFSGGNVQLVSQDTSAAQLQFTERPDQGTNITSFRARPMTIDVPYTLPDTQGGVSTVLTNDGSGNLYWTNIHGGLTYGVKTVSQFTGNQHNVELDASKTIFRFSSSANMNITGFTNGWDGRLIIVVNVGSNSIALQNQNVGSSAINRILIASGNSIAMQANEALSLVYDAITERWRPIAKTP